MRFFAFASCAVVLLAASLARAYIEAPYAMGRIVSESDIRGWTRCIEELLSNSELRASFATKGLERAELYSCRVIAPEYRRLYLELANRLTVPRPPRDVRSSFRQGAGKLHARVRSALSVLSLAVRD